MSGLRWYTEPEAPPPPPERPRTVKRVAWGVAAVLVATGSASVMTVSANASGSSPVRGAIYTTNIDRSVVNGNTQYEAPEDVYLNGGPRKHGPTLEDGTYFFAVLEPGGQSDPNDLAAKNLSTSDSATARSFVSVGGHILPNGTKTTHAISSAQVIQLSPYKATSNPGGVYIAAVCRYVEDDLGAPLPVSPSDCKYDMFKVKAGEGTTTPFDAPTADKTALPAGTISYGWGIAKTRTSAPVITGLSGTANYSVVATRSVTGRAWTVSGDINIYNTNPTPLAVTVAESALTADDSTTAPSSSCGLAAGQNGGSTVPAKPSDADYGTVAVPYTCTVSADPGQHQFLNVATVTYKDGDGKDQTLPAYSDWFDFTTVVPTLATGSEPATITATDYFNGATVGTALGSGTWDAAAGTLTWNYQNTVTSTTLACQVVPNVAKIDGTTHESGASVTICPPVIATGHTMGFWQNKNGQLLVTGDPGLCAYLSNYPAVLFDLPKDAMYGVCKGAKGLPVTGAVMGAYVTGVIKAAAAAGDGAPMFRGQFLATALGAKLLGGDKTNFWVTDPTSTALGYGSGNVCKSEAQVLAGGDAKYGVLSNPALSPKSIFMAVKSTYDAVNNNAVYACTP